ncbi:MAG: ABC transporter substrate-binding protein [Arenicellales bacterium]|jgi:branched-chain amino acid transport system substrate-binding protein|nr:ABC transporter permease [Acidiferrobacteraceae bacterium]MDP6123575.1 ABC transporter substrate-binding protein [Arenicellales bacterium]MDP7155551.1 ABC transporter substrate-binding protein [Arenicellales bacterium]|tara:strand:+ start:8765 stop:10099 length:1335 start_codon:yes stop_codon:yes gene_type:complete
MRFHKLGLSLIASVIAVAPITVVQADEQFIPALVYRTGPYAAGGTGFFGGMLDYFTYLNMKHEGLNGVKITWEECETAYNSDRGVECYERLKGKDNNSGPVHPLSTGITYRLIERATASEVPIISMGYGRTDATDGRVFPYVFPLVTNYWSQNTAKIKYIGMKEGGMDKLKGKKIANLYHESGYGKETIPVLDKQAAKYGFEIKHYPVPHPGLDQKATWMSIARKYKPDWVILRGWGVMNPTALKEAARNRFPANRIVGVWWSGAEEDVIPAGKAAIGYVAAGFHPSGRDHKVIDGILETVHGELKGNISPQRVGTIYYNRGLIAAMLTTEAILTAQNKFGKGKTMTGSQLRWGIENLDLTQARLDEIGFGSLMAPLKISCIDHEGGGPVMFQEWDGNKWVQVTDWIKTDQTIVRPMIEESAAKYAKEKGITPRSGDSLGSNCG